MEIASFFVILIAYVLGVGLSLLIFYYIVKVAVRSGTIEAADYERKRLARQFTA